MELQVEEFHSSNGWFERWNARFNVSFKAIAGEEKAVTPEITNLWWETRHDVKTSDFYFYQITVVHLLEELACCLTVIFRSRSSHRRCSIRKGLTKKPFLTEKKSCFLETKKV